MRSVYRGLVVLACSGALGAGLWFVAERLGSPTSTPMRPGLDQPASVGVEHTVTYLAAGTVLWTALWLAARLLGVVRKRPRARV